MKNNQSLQLHSAAKNGNYTTIRYLLFQGADINCINKYGNTPLHVAIKHNQKDIVKLLLQKGADVNLGSNKGHTALHLAVFHNREDIIKLLLDAKGINPKLINNNDSTAIDLAELEGNKELLSLISSKDRERSDSTKELHTSIINGDTKKVKLLLEKGVYGNQIHIDGDYNALMLAINRDQKDIVKLLLNTKDVDNNAKYYGRSPLDIAIDKRNFDITKILLGAKGIDLNDINKNNMTIRKLAASPSNKELLKLFSSKATEVFASTQKLHNAITRGDTKIVKLLLDAKGVDINHINTHGYNALHDAIARGRTEIVKLLLDTKSVDINHINSAGYNALHAAIARGYTEIVKLLLDAKSVDINHINSAGYNALHAAIARGHSEIVKLLLDAKGVDISHVNKYGSNALVAAIHHKHIDIAKLIIEASEDLTGQAHNIFSLFNEAFGTANFFDLINTSKKAADGFFACKDHINDFFTLHQRNNGGKFNDEIQKIYDIMVVSHKYNFMGYNKPLYQTDGKDPGGLINEILAKIYTDFKDSALNDFLAELLREGLEIVIKHPHIHYIFNNTVKVDIKSFIFGEQLNTSGGGGGHYNPESMSVSILNSYTDIAKLNNLKNTKDKVTYQSLKFNYLQKFMIAFVHEHTHAFMDSTFPNSRRNPFMLCASNTSPLKTNLRQAY
jgi:ankyrin repeat protein